MLFKNKWCRKIVYLDYNLINDVLKWYKYIFKITIKISNKTGLIGVKFNDNLSIKKMIIY